MSFDERKKKVLDALGDSAQDFSPKGGLDAPIEGFVNWINAQPDWCTTSSCSGRITLYRCGIGGIRASRWTRRAARGAAEASSCTAASGVLPPSSPGSPGPAQA